MNWNFKPKYYALSRRLGGHKMNIEQESQEMAAESEANKLAAKSDSEARRLAAESEAMK